MTDSLHEIIAALEAMYNSKKLIRKADYWARCAGEAAEYLRAIAAGKYKRVVHAHIVGRGWDLHCSNCGASADIGNDYCPDCGARMDGKNNGYSEVCSCGERRGESK